MSMTSKPCFIANCLAYSFPSPSEAPVMIAFPPEYHLKMFLPGLNHVHQIDHKSFNELTLAEADPSPTSAQNSLGHFVGKYWIFI
jgi:hypothetical protein